MDIGSADNQRGDAYTANEWDKKEGGCQQNVHLKEEEQEQRCHTEHTEGTKDQGEYRFGTAPLPTVNGE